MTNNDELAIKLKDVARHSVDGYGRQDISYNDPEGEFVFYSDYAALTEAMEAAKKRIAELEREKETMTAAALAMRDDMRDARSLLEARTVSVKLPEPPGPMSVGARTVYCGIVADVVAAFQAGLAATGIKLEVGE